MSLTDKGRAWERDMEEECWYNIQQLRLEFEVKAKPWYDMLCKIEARKPVRITELELAAFKKSAGLP